MEEKQSFLKQKIDLESPNRNIFPITTSIERDGKLSVGGCSIEELVKKYDSPLYILDEITLRNSCKAYKKALEKYYPGKSLPIYASKANSSIFMSSLVSSEGLGLDAVSEGELLTAIKGGVPNEKIVFHGNNKSDKELEFAVRNNIKVIVDNDYDLKRLDEISNSFNHDLEIMIRFTPGIECHTHEYIRTGSFDSKFGFGIEYLNILFNRISNTKHLKLKGLHAHIGSQIFELDPHKDLGEIMVKVILDAKKFGPNIEELNVGGGLGIRYTESDDPPSIIAFFVLNPASYKAFALFAPTPGSVAKVSIFFLELTVLVFDFVFKVFADLVTFFSFFKGVSVDTALLNRIDFSLLKNLEIIAIL